MSEWKKIFWWSTHNQNYLIKTSEKWKIWCAVTAVNHKSIIPVSAPPEPKSEMIPSQAICTLYLLYWNPSRNVLLQLTGNVNNKRHSFRNKCVATSKNSCVNFFYVCGSVHHKILSITVQQDASISSLFIYCKVTLITPIIRCTQNCNYSLGYRSYNRCSYLIPTWPTWPRCNEVAEPMIWPVPEAVVTVLFTPDDGCNDTRNM